MRFSPIGFAAVEAAVDFGCGWVVIGRDGVDNIGSVAWNAGEHVEGTDDFGAHGCVRVGDGRGEGAVF